MPKDSPSLSSQKLISGDTSLVRIAPDIPYDNQEAMYPLRLDPKDGKIKPSFQWRECGKRILVCVRWEKKTVYFEDLSWFYYNQFVLKKVRLK